MAHGPGHELGRGPGHGLGHGLGHGPGHGLGHGPGPWARLRARAMFFFVCGFFLVCCCFNNFLLKHVCFIEIGMFFFNRCVFS